MLARRSQVPGKKFPNDNTGVVMVLRAKEPCPVDSDGEMDIEVLGKKSLGEARSKALPFSVNMLFNYTFKIKVPLGVVLEVSAVLQVPDGEDEVPRY